MTAGEPEINQLLLRMRNGDREAAAIFISRYGDRIRRRVRSRIRPHMRRLFDSTDILSTVARRMDGYVRTGRLQADNEAQLWALAFRIAENAAVDKSRVVKRLRKIEGEDSPFAQQILQRVKEADDAGPGMGDLALEQLVASIDDPVDREILLLWLSGTPHTVTAQAVNLAPTAVRKRWQMLKDRLRVRLAPHRPHGVTDSDGAQPEVATP